VSESPVLKPGGFWVCPACGQRNKVWAPCSSCGTALTGMPPATAAPTVETAPPGRSRRRWPLYALAAVGVIAAIAVAVGLTRVLGGASLVSEEQEAPPAVRADARRRPPAATPEPLPPSTAPPAVIAPPPVPSSPTPPAAVYTPSTRIESPGYSIPAPPSRPPPEPRAGADLRARQQAVRAAQARFDRAEAALAAAGLPESDAETPEMREMEEAARALREAEAALDRARRRGR
jgi:hypothetical protein